MEEQQIRNLKKVDHLCRLFSLVRGLSSARQLPVACARDATVTSRGIKVSLREEARHVCVWTLRETFLCAPMAAAAQSLKLYRQILREHKQRLPALMRKLGDDYVRSEFKAHKTAKPEQVAQFMHAWNDYLLKIRLQRDRFGSNLNDSAAAALNEEQKKKLNDLKAEALKSLRD